MNYEVIDFRMKKIPWLPIVISTLLIAAVVFAIFEYSINQGKVDWSNSFRGDILPISFEAPVVGLSDGDSIKVQFQGDEVKIILFGIDAPETWQFHGLASTLFLQRILCDPVTVEKKTTDRYGRTVAVLWCNGVDINRKMVEEGYAWANRAYSNDYVLSENNARSAGIGLWQEENPTPPWEYRGR